MKATNAQGKELTLILFFEILNDVQCTFDEVSLRKDSTIEHYQSLEPWRYTYLDRFVSYQDASSDGYSSYMSLELHLVGMDNRTLILKCYEVTGLKFECARGYGQLSVVSVADMRERQWEGVRYEVSDDEGQLFFYCRRFEASLVGDMV